MLASGRRTRYAGPEMQPRVAYWDEALGRLVESEEPDWDAERFGAMMSAGCEASARDTLPAPPPLPEEYDR